MYPKQANPSSRYKLILCFCTFHTKSGNYINLLAGDPDFNVTMGSFDGTELCELVGLYILQILGEKHRKRRIRLYRDERLACFGYTSGPQADGIRKDFIKIFREDF